MEMLVTLLEGLEEWAPCWVSRIDSQTNTAGLACQGSCYPHNNEKGGESGPASITHRLLTTARILLHRN